MRLQTKVLLILLPLALASGALILLLSRQAVTRILVAEVAGRGFLQLQNLSAEVVPGVTARDERALLPLLNSAAGQMRASYGMVLDPSGLVLAHTNVLQTGKRYEDPVTLRALRREQPGFEVVVSGGKQALDVAIPVWAQGENFLLSQEKEGKTRLGTVRLGLPLDEALVTRTRILRRIALILLASGGVMMAAIWLFLRGLLKPLALLARLAERIGRGERDVRVPALGEDEIGDLAGSFNKMVDDLKTTTVSKDYVDNIIKSMADSLVVIESDGRIRGVNKATLDLLGYEEDELVGKQVSILLGDGNKLFDSAAIKSLVQKGSSKDAESFYKSKSGEKIPIMVSSSLLRNGKGESEGVVIVAKDLTKTKRMEMMLLQSEKLSAVGQLAAGVAHEINNPLGVILGFAQSAARKVEESDLLYLPIRSIEREALRCRTLVQNLLAFSRQSKARMERVDLNETVIGTLSIIEAQGRVKGVEIKAELSRLEPMMADKNQLQQVIVNLCNNAIDAMPRGGKITVRTSESGSGGDRMVRLDVADTGTGIPKEIRDKIFDPFFTTKDVGKGTGLGLSLVYEIVQKHGGSIRVESEVGRGSTFIVALPAEHAAQESKGTAG